MAITLAYELGIILGCLIAVAFIAGFIKLYINKKRLEANQKKADEEAAAKSTDKEKLVGKRALGEGDYFGVRALEHGYFGGVAQTRPSSPASSYKLAPDAKLVDWGQVNKLRSDSASMTSSTFDFQDRDSSSASLPAGGSGLKKPSPLRLQPSDADIRSHNMSSVGGVGGNFLPPAPSPRSIRAPSPHFAEEKGSNWVSPLDVHFSRPGTPVRPTSFLPKLQFPLEFGKSELADPLPDFSKSKSETTVDAAPVLVKPPPAAGGRVKTPKEIYAEFSQQGFAESPTLSTFSQQGPAKSPTFSTFSKQESLAKSPTFSTFSDEEQPRSKSPTFSVFSQQPPPRPSRLSMKSMFSTETAPVRNVKEDFSQTFQLPPVPLEDLAPVIPSINPDRFPKERQVYTPTSPIRDSILNRQQHQPNTAGARRSHEWTLPSPTLPDEMMDAEWQPSEKAIIRASVVSKQRVSVIRGRGAQSQDLDFQFAKMQARGHSMAASSMYSTRTSILESEEASKRHTRTRSQSSEARRRSSSRSLSRTRDSLRKKSSDSFKSAASHRRSRDRDQMHFDPSSHQRNRSGSVQGRSVDFDQPRESPFSNSNRMTHSASSSVSTTESLSRFEIPSPPKPILTNSSSSRMQVMPQDPDRLSIAPQVRGRSGSEASQNSIGDFYDSYFRQSTMARGSAIPMGPAGSRTSVQERAQAFEDRARGRSGSRPAPLKIGNGNGGLGVGSGYGGFNTIVEVATPVPSPMVAGAGGADRNKNGERFPQMI